MKLIDILIIIAVSIGFSLFAWKVTRFQYSIEEKDILMQWYFIGLIPINLRVGLDSVADAQKIPLKFSFFLKNPLHYFLYGKPSREVVLIIRKRGHLKNIIISPRNPDEFIAALSKRTAPQQMRPVSSESGGG